MKKMIAVLAPLALILSACTTTDMATTNTTTTTQQLGTAALKIAINAKCTGCVSEKAPQNITAVDVATAAIDPAARTTIISNAVTKTINACVAEAVN